MSRRRLLVAALGITLAGAVAAAITVTALATQPASARNAGQMTASHVLTTPSPAPPPPALQVVAVGHADGTTLHGVDGQISIKFSSPLLSAPQVTLTPALAGNWTISGDTATFVPTATPLPGVVEHLTIPAGVTDEAGGVLAATYTNSWTNRPGSVERLQQLLAEAGYLPLTFRPTTAEPASASALTASAYAPVAGTFTWRFANTPASLQGLWSVGENTQVTSGAVYAFEAAHNLSTDGSAGPAVWGALVADVASRTVTTRPYTYVYVTKGAPEQLRLWENGAWVLTTPANTGVAAAPTPDGSWPVYARFTSETMTGRNPDGTKYSDPGVPWINYFNGGDAVHGFPRATYGFAQSVGCVELPIPTAEKVYGDIGYGTVVTVTG